ncbi:MAG: zinc-dependent alcohol dehydrogenase family protein [Mariprofundaceae bacterium]|nr:zinc-dependent alcohol dehydrogenase family protein [Mariprofundaceae bacterium]
MSKTGSPGVLEMRQIQKPVMTHPCDVLVHLKAAGVNPLDTKLRNSGTYAREQQEAILGCDGAGVVEAVGESVTRFKPGDAVYYCHGGIGLAPGNNAEFAVVPEWFLAEKPASLNFIEAAATPLVLITAWESLFDRARIQAGQKVFVHAGAGGVGHVAIQLARIAGCDVATTVGSDEKAAFVRRLGADHVINYRKQDVTQALLEWTDGKGVDVAFDTVGGGAFRQLISAVRVYGDLVTILQVPEDTDWKTVRLRNIRISQELMLTPMIMNLKNAAHHQSDILKRCAAYFDDGSLSVHVSHTLLLEQTADAHRLIEAAGMMGKIVLEI